MKAVSHYPHGTKGEYRQIKKESGLEVSHALMSITSKGDMNMVAEVELKLSRAVTDFATNNPEKVIAEQRQLLIKVDRLKLCKLKTMEITKIIEVLKLRENRFSDLPTTYSEEIGLLKDIGHDDGLQIYGQFSGAVEKARRKIEATGTVHTRSRSNKWRVNALIQTNEGFRLPYQESSSAEPKY